jgi:hypothetical protein
MTGSTRWELTLEERAIYVDFLALASLNDPLGRFSFHSMKQLSDQIKAPSKKIENAMNKFVNFKKISFDSKKNLVVIENWQKYQSEYLRQKPYRSPEKQKENCNKVTSEGVTKLPLEERREKENIREGEEKEKDHPKNDFLNILKSIHPYPFNEDDDGHMFDFCSREYPDVDLCEELEKKIQRWKDHPEELKGAKDPRDKLFEWFGKEQAFQLERKEAEFGQESKAETKEEKRR